MRNAMKVAKWEIKRNMKNKSFLIGLFLTPIIIVAFMVLGSIFGDSDSSEAETTYVYINDGLGIFPSLQGTVEQASFNWEMELTDIPEKEVTSVLEDTENTAYVFVDQRALEQGSVPVFTSEEINPYFMDQVQLLEAPLKAMQMQELGVSNEVLTVVSSNIELEAHSPDDTAEEESHSDTSNPENEIARMIPGAFAGFILISIVFTGMAIFQSASQEKKDKIAEIILSSVTPSELMQGKIMGYFVLGIIQTAVSLMIVLPVLAWRMDINMLEYLLVPELALYVLIAILGYLLFASIFVGIGATMSDITTAGNFQGLVMMLPFLPFVFIGPVLSDPSGLWAQIGTYLPFTSPGVLLLRLTILEEWPWLEIIISLVILVASIWLFMKLAGKIFKVGILMYGKNASPAEIWKWIRA
ncbi:ABC transporter permease [Oceanobacillus piezotolerans]|uniref:ABC transporter permease n=1 Tax=Oceanobacillus piezotolerans TaxID=2448030 RepID=A0A498D3N4_9BACI|nr:ABC transporter permease [Oceanobacillus piezotolerans]RLL42792.1 ABC transporter permease [Oceanobacillus piezotolerans]